MSSGTTIITRALQSIGAHSIVSPAAPESIVLGMEKLNSMLEMWLTLGIDLGTIPLEKPGDDLGEPSDTTNGIINKLALELAPNFDNGKVVVSVDLRINATVGYNNIKNLYQTVCVPDKVVSSTLPVGAGNQRRSRQRTYKPIGSTVNG